MSCTYIIVPEVVNACLIISQHQIYVKLTQFVTLRHIQQIFSKKLIYSYQAIKRNSLKSTFIFVELNRFLCTTFFQIPHKLGQNTLSMPVYRGKSRKMEKRMSTKSTISEVTGTPRLAPVYIKYCHNNYLKKQYEKRNKKKTGTDLETQPHPRQGSLQQHSVLETI